VYKRIFLLLLIVHHFLIPSLSASDQQTIENSELLVRFEKPLKNTAREIINMYPSVKGSLEKTFGWKLTVRPTVLIMRGKETFQTIANSKLVVAVAIPHKNLIVIDNSKANTHPFSLETTLKHELCHLMLHHYISRTSLPKWLNEGVAQWVSGGIAEIAAGGEGKKALKEATLSRQFIRLKDLSRTFPANEQSFVLAYEESKSFVEYIVENFGEPNLLETLNNLKYGNDIETAILKGIGISLGELEVMWQDSLIRRITWFVYLSSNLYTILFFFAGLLTIYGFLRFMWKKRRYKDEEEDILDTDI
jgi:hypothetical protein